MSTAPQFTETPNKGTPGSLTAANISKVGTGATGRLLIFTAGASGSILPFVRAHPMGANVDTLARYFKNNGSDPETAANNSLIAEQTIPASTLSETVANASYDTPLNVILQGGANPERIYVLLATSVATGIAFTPMNGGDL
jgi:hypothetical protein